MQAYSVTGPSWASRCDGLHLLPASTAVGCAEHVLLASSTQHMYHKLLLSKRQTLDALKDENVIKKLPLSS